MTFPIVLEIPRATPSKNEMRRKYRHPLAYKTLRALWSLEIGIALRPKTRMALQGYIERHRPKMRVEITCRRKKLMEPQNLPSGLAPLLDVLCIRSKTHPDGLGFIVNDTEEFLEHPTPVQEKCGSMRPVTMLTIEPAK